ncbi:MAG: cytochrome c biogenesis protein CcsA, partial [Actinomycetota bacterium]
MTSSSLRLLPAVVAATMLAGLAAIFTWVPTDCSRVVNGACFEGTVQRIFYVHVPSAWIAYLAYAVVLVASIAYLRGDSPRWDTIAHSSAEVGVLFTGITLATGMIWGKSVWGIYWTWDARLTLTFVLFLIYLGYLIFRAMAADPGQGSRIAAVIGIAGFAVVPLVHFSVQWWRGQHPDSVVVTPGEASRLPAEMLATMLFMVVVFTLMFSALLALRV